MYLNSIIVCLFTIQLNIFGANYYFFLLNVIWYFVQIALEMQGDTNISVSSQNINLRWEQQNTIADLISSFLPIHMVQSLNLRHSLEAK